MIDHRRLLILVITISLIGVCALFFYSSTIEPDPVSIEDIGDEEVGSVVITNGTINNARVLSDGSLLLSVCDISSQDSINVYIPANVHSSWEGGNLTPGTVVEITGEVILYGEEFEISISSVDDVSILAPPDTVRYELWQVMESLELMDGFEIVTTGSLRNLNVIRSSGELVGTSFELVDEHDGQTIGLDCIVFDRDLTQDFDNGDIVLVGGELGFYRNKGVWQLVVETAEHYL